MKELKYVYGPVPSRRLGFSLGIDLVPFKTCTYDCIYCHLGKTTKKTVVRKSFVDYNDVLEEIHFKLKTHPLPDFITLAGSGEPSLYSNIGKLTNKLKELTDVPVALITNGSLLWDKDIQTSIKQVDLVIPSLDAGSASTFNYINRPHTNITYRKMLNGLKEFRRKYSGQIWLEILLIEGITARDDEIERIITYAKEIHPDKVQFNTVVRPAAENYASAVPKVKLEKFRRMLGDNAEIIADFHKARKKKNISVSEKEVLRLLKCRPCTFEDIANGLSIPHNEVLKCLDYLTENKLVVLEKRNRKVFYLPKTLYKTKKYVYDIESIP